MMSADRPAGRATDAEVAETVMGLTVISHDWPCGYMPDGCNLEAVLPEVDEVQYLPILPAHPPLRWLDNYPERHPVTAEGYGVRPVKFYSTDWSAMQLVVERMQQRGYFFQLHGWGDDGTFLARFLLPDTLEAGKLYRSAKGAPHAVCLAALSALAARPEAHDADPA